MNKYLPTSTLNLFTKTFTRSILSLSAKKWMGYFFALLFFITGNVKANQKDEIICSYAPSQSNKMASLTAVAGSSAIANAVIAATGLTFTVVTHSSGAYILTGTSGYIAGTIGTTANVLAAAPVIVGVGLIVGGAAVTIELICARKNHPEEVRRIEAAAKEFSSRFINTMADTKIAAENFKKSVEPTANAAATEIKRITTDVWKYSYQKSSDLMQKIRK